MLTVLYFSIQVVDFQLNISCGCVCPFVGINISM